MNFLSIFDVIGPNMIGPSSSHTAGAVSIALMARKMFPEYKKSDIYTVWFFCQNLSGHGTDRRIARWSIRIFHRRRANSGCLSDCQRKNITL